MKMASQGGLAVVTGAAGGLGSAFANQLAERGYRLLLVDRRQQQLEQLCTAISGQHGVSAEPFAVDLCRREEVERLAERLTQTANLELLVNNAGFGTFDYFIDTDPQYLVGMVDVHVIAPTMLNRAVLPGMIERNHGAIINVSSVSAWFQSACNVQYSATKSFLAMFSLALAQELRGTNVRVQALCPGFMRTDFHAAQSMQGFDARCVPAAHLWTSPDVVVKCSLNRLAGKQVIVSPGFTYRLLGRLAMMPVLQPLFQWATWGPRRAPSPPPAVEPRPAPAFSVANESAAVS